MGTGCSLENLPESRNDRDGWRKVEKFMLSARLDDDDNNNDIYVYVYVCRKKSFKDF